MKKSKTVTGGRASGVVGQGGGGGGGGGGGLFHTGAAEHAITNSIKNEKPQNLQNSNIQKIKNSKNQTFKKYTYFKNETSKNKLHFKNEKFKNSKSCITKKTSFFYLKLNTSHRKASKSKTIISKNKNETFQK